MFLFAAVTFALLDQHSISLGDDYGYMFTDSRLHGGDGGRVHTFADCWNTQLSHYCTTNGRFVVHLFTQVFVSIAPWWVYKALNALIFATVWLYLCRLGARSASFSFRRGAVTWTAIWLLMPKPGLIMLSLTAFSLNYMWSGAAALAFLWYYSREGRQWCGYKFVLFGLLAFLAGFSQESYSLPLAGALVLTPFITNASLTRRQCVVCGIFLAGAVLCAVAPGNINHLQQGGGLESEGLAHKVSHLLSSLLLTPLLPLAFALIIYWIKDRKACKAFIKSNLLLSLAIVIGLAFDALSFTATRQLYSVSFFSLVMLLRLPVWRGGYVREYGTQTAIALTLATCLMLGGAFVLRRDVYRRHAQLLQFTERQAVAAAGGKYMSWTDVRQAPYNTSPRLWSLLGSFAPDPWERSEFYIPFNRQVRRVMSRRHTPGGNAKALITVLPLPESKIIKMAQLGDTAVIDSRYAVTALINDKDLQAPAQSEGFMCGDTVYYIIPLDYE